MIDLVPVEKDRSKEHAVPTAWREPLSLIVDALVEGDFRLARGIAGVAPVDADTAAAISENISGYGVHLKSLPEETWGTSVCQWMETYWNVLVDLYSVEEGSSDLVLSVRVFEAEDGYLLEVQLVYVP